MILMLFGSTLQDTLVLLAASLANAFPIYCTAAMPREEQFPGAELGKGLGAPRAHPRARQPHACSGLREPSPLDLGAAWPPASASRGDFFSPTDVSPLLSLLPAPARSGVTAVVQLAAVAFPSLSVFAGTGCGALAAAAALELVEPPRAPLSGQK